MVLEQVFFIFKHGDIGQWDICNSTLMVFAWHNDFSKKALRKLSKPRLISLLDANEHGKWLHYTRAVPK